MKIPIFRPLWNLSGKIAEWLIARSKDFYFYAGICTASCIMAVVVVVDMVNPAAFSNLFSPHTVWAASINTRPNTQLAQYAGNITVKASSLNNYYNSIETFNMDTTPLIGGYFIDDDLTGSAIADSQGNNVPYMPPSGNDSAAWYFWQPYLQQNQTYNYTLYTGPDDLEGDIVYFPSSTGMTVNASNTLDFGSDDFTISINGYFDANNTGADNIIFSNNQFKLQYTNGQLVFSNGSGGVIATQISTLGNYTLQNGIYSTVLPGNTSTAVVTLVANPTSISRQTVNTVKSTNAPVTLTTFTTTFSPTATSSLTYITAGTRAYQLTSYVPIVQRTVIANNVTTQYLTTYQLADGVVPIIFNTYSTTLTDDGTHTLVLTDDSTQARTIRAGSAPTTSVVTKNGSGSSTVATSVTTSIDKSPATFVSYDVGYTGGYTHYYDVYTQTWTITQKTYSNTQAYTNKTTTSTTHNAGQVGDRIGLMYYDIPSNTYAANWSGGDKTLTIARVGSTLTVSDGLTVLMSIPVASDPVATDGTSNWTIAQQGAIKYLRSMTINNNGSNVASWEWEKGTTFTDQTGTGNTAYPNFITAAIPNNSTISFSGYRAINNYTSQTTTTTTTTTTTSGLIDTDTPDSDINKQTDESKWEDIFFFGMFYKLAQEGGIPPSLFFIPLFGAFALLAFGVAYHFTRDILVSGLAGNAALGLGITMSVLYTIPLILGLIAMFVLLVKRKTVSL